MNHPVIDVYLESCFDSAGDKVYNANTYESTLVERLRSHGHEPSVRGRSRLSLSDLKGCNGFIYTRDGWFIPIENFVNADNNVRDILATHQYHEYIDGDETTAIINFFKHQYHYQCEEEPLNRMQRRLKRKGFLSPWPKSKIREDMLLPDIPIIHDKPQKYGIKYVSENPKMYMDRAKDFWKNKGWWTDSPDKFVSYE